MPVPVQTTPSGPRRLLRDVVFDQILAAIQDGTLEPGERLNDDDLVNWLGVSRTPVREATARLVSLGLVEMEANRYTRVATPSTDDYVAALHLFVGLQELAARWAAPKCTPRDEAGLQEVIGETRGHATRQDPAVLDDILAITTLLIRVAGNRLLAETADGLMQRIQFLAVPAREHFQWDLEGYLEALGTAVAARDGEAAAAAVRVLSDLVDRHIDALQHASCKIR